MVASFIFARKEVRRLEEEVWKDIEGFPGYQVSDFGRVMNKDGLIIHQQKRKKGYVKVELWKDGESYTRDVHRLVAIAFLGIHEGLDVNHINGKKDDNRLTNLEWCTKSENMQHAMRMGLYTPKAPEPKRQPIRIIETGEVFPSITDCAKAIDSSVINILHSIREDISCHHSVKGRHFETISNEEYEKIISMKRKPFLYPHQKEAVGKMKNGCILNGSTGSGKSRTGLYYYFSKYGGSIDPDYIPMRHKPKPPDLYIITTPKKRDDLEFEGELIPFLLSTNPKNNYFYGNKVVIDSWQNIKKYADVKDSFFLFDEDKVTGSGVWVKTFLKIAKNNEWIILSATCGDTWLDFVPVFVANGFYKNRSEFNREHVKFSPYTKFPKVEGYYNTGRLIRLRNKILVDMEFKRHTIPHHEDVFVRYDISKYKDAMRLRWDPYRNEPIQQASGLCYVLRRIVNEDESRQKALLEIFEKHPKMIVFYSFDYEREILLNLAYGNDVEVAEWSGHAHQEIPNSKQWVYLCQYTSACEGFNCIKTDTIVFYSQTYSYKTLAQAEGRINRLNTPFIDLYYYHLRSRSGIDLAISKALSQKKKFNERKFAKWD